MTFSWYHNSHLFHFAPAEHQIFKDLMGNTCFSTIRFSALLQIGPGPSVIIALNKESGGEICFVSTWFSQSDHSIRRDHQIKYIMGIWLLCLYLMFISAMVVRMYENCSLFELFCLLSLQFFPPSINWLSSVFHSKCQKSAPRTCSRYGKAVLDMWYYSLGYHLSQAGVLLLRWYDLRFGKWLSNAISNTKFPILAMKIQFSP